MSNIRQKSGITTAVVLQPDQKPCDGLQHRSRGTDGRLSIGGRCCHRSFVRQKAATAEWRPTTAFARAFRDLEYEPATRAYREQADVFAFNYGFGACVLYLQDAHTILEEIDLPRGSSWMNDDGLLSVCIPSDKFLDCGRVLASLGYRVVVLSRRKGSGDRVTGKIVSIESALRGGSRCAG